MRGKITLSLKIEDGDQPMTIELESANWSTGGNPRFIAQDFTACVDALSAKIQGHLAQEYGDIRAAEEKP